MGNKNLIIIVGIILLWFMMIRPISKRKAEAKEETKETDTNTEEEKDGYNYTFNRGYTH